MAYYYWLVIKTERTGLIKEIFESKVITLQDGRVLPLIVETRLDAENKWWVEVHIEGASTGSPGGDDPELLDKHEREMTIALYKILKEARDFRYAIAGVAVQDYCSEKELDLEIREPNEGFIISKELWEKHGKPGFYQDFNGTHVWCPFE